MIDTRNPEDIYQARGRIKNGTFSGRWHFSFGENYDPENIHFGTLRVFNDDTLSPGAIWPLHHHTKNEVITYCVKGIFRHADQDGEGGILKKGWVQHTTIGTGMDHSEINDQSDKEMRFIQMWFYPEKLGLKPSVEQMKVQKKERTNTLKLLISKNPQEALSIRSDAEVYSSFVEQGKNLIHNIKEGWGSYLYLIEGGPVSVNSIEIPHLGIAKIKNEASFEIKALYDSELLIVDVLLKASYIK